MAHDIIRPLGVGPYAIGFAIVKEGKGRYLEHDGSTYGFRAELWAYRSKGYGLVIMTHAASGDALIGRDRQIIEHEYKWDAVDEPIPSRYGP